MKESNSDYGSARTDGRMDPLDRAAASELGGSDPIAVWIDARIEAYVDGDLPPEERRRLESFVSVDEFWAEQLRLAQAVRTELSTIESPLCPSDVAQSVLSRARAQASPQLIGAERIQSGARRPNLADVVRARFDEAWTVFLRPALAVAPFAALVVSAALVGRTESDPASIADARTPNSEVVADDEPTSTNAATANADARTDANDALPNTDAAPADASGTPTDASAAPSGAVAATRLAGDVTDPEVDRALQEAKWALAFVSDVSREAGASLRRSVLEQRVAEPIRRALGAALDGGSTS